MLYICSINNKQTLYIMTTATYNELKQIAQQVNRTIIDLNGENRTFEIDSDTMTAVIVYSATLGYDKGDFFTAPCSWINSESVTVMAVYTEDGNDSEAMEVLAKMLN